jgi:DNA-binding response OmpR family regulator
VRPRASRAHAPELAKQASDLLLVDWMLPDTNGLELTARSNATEGA